jgi:uncharacterized membrane protein YgdD (TMEM256/DUF423 family)
MDVFVFDPVVHTLICPMNSVPRWSILAAGSLGFSGIALGAFGAHALKETLTTRGTLPIWQTAVSYQLVHAVALLALAGWSSAGRKAGWIAGAWVLGTVCFSGSLYWLALGGPSFLGPVTPFGGVAFLVGWALVTTSAFSSAIK